MVAAACRGIGQAWPRVVGSIIGNASSSAEPASLSLADVFDAWRSSHAASPDAVRPPAGHLKAPGPSNLIALAIQSVLVAGGERNTTDAHWRRVFSSARQFSKSS